MGVDNIITYRDVVAAGPVERTRLALVIVDLGALVFNRARCRSPEQSRSLTSTGTVI